MSAKKKQQKKTQPPAVDHDHGEGQCICVSHLEYEPTEDDFLKEEGIWLHYENIEVEGEKLRQFRFAAQLYDTRIEYKTWLEEAKQEAQFQKEVFHSPELARKAFSDLIDRMKTSGYKFIYAKT